VDKLVDRHSVEQIAAAYLRLHNAKVSAPEELSAAKPHAPERERKPRSSEPFGPSVWFSISIGRSKNAEPRWLLPMLCRVGSISSKQIGAIRIQQDISFVEISAASVDRFLEGVGPDMTLEAGAVLKRLDAEPDFVATSPDPKPPHSARQPHDRAAPKPKGKRKEKWRSGQPASDTPKPKLKKNKKKRTKPAAKSKNKLRKKGPATPAS
ncbi:MAG: DbpA RNA binding domain-containing protein, partial [Pseudomonadota bacterium]